jgi:hypothetical protein
MNEFEVSNCNVREVFNLYDNSMPGRPTFDLAPVYVLMASTVCGSINDLIWQTLKVGLLAVSELCLH